MILSIEIPLDFVFTWLLQNFVDIEILKPSYKTIVREITPAQDTAHHNCGIGLSYKLLYEQIFHKC